MTGIETLKFTKLTVISKYANRTALLDGGYGSTEEYKEALLQEYGVDGAMLLRDWQFIAGVGMGNGMSVTKFGAKQSDFTSLRQLLTIAYGGIDKGPYLILLLTREEIPEEFDTKPKKPLRRGSGSSLVVPEDAQEEKDEKAGIQNIKINVPKPSLKKEGGSSSRVVRPSTTARGMNLTVATQVAARKGSYTELSELSSDHGLTYFTTYRATPPTEPL